VELIGLSRWKIIDPREDAIISRLASTRRLQRTIARFSRCAPPCDSPRAGHDAHHIASVSEAIQPSPEPSFRARVKRASPESMGLRILARGLPPAERVYLPPVLPPTLPACARLSPGGPPSRPFVGPLSRRARPGLRLSWSAVGSLIIGSALSCFASAGLPFVICAYAVPPMDTRKAVAAATEISFIVYLRFGLKPNPPVRSFVPELQLRPRWRLTEFLQAKAAAMM
jgi:hypothetical protein